MNHRVVWIGAILLAASLVARGEGPDEKYVRVYNLIQEADALNSTSQARQAAVKYLEAQSILKTYPSQYPGWNEKVVNYRLGYLASKLEALTQYVPATNPSATATTNLLLSTASGTNQAQALQGELSRLMAQNALLEAKLREALSVQPAGSDPRELTKAEERIKQLQKEIDLLKVSLEQERSRSAKMVDSAAVDQERQILAEVKLRLAQQTELTSTLQQENVALKKQIADLKLQSPLSAPTNGTSEELQVARTTIAALQATNIALKTEKILLEARLVELAKERPAPASAKMKALLQERDELKKKLAVATKELNRRKTYASISRTDDLAKQLESVLARLDVYEAKAVPYTAEEQAFFRQGDTNVVVSVPGAEKKTVKELPPGSGPLIAEAQRAADSGRFGDAEKLYLQVLRQDERHVFTLSSLAVVQMEQNRFDEAERTLKKALAVDPRDPASLYLLGRLKYEQQKYDEALEALSLSAKVIPDEARTQYFLGKALIQKGNRAAAETALRKAVQLKPGWGEAHHSLALVYATQQPPFKELAQWHYNKAKDNGYPSDPELDKLLEDKKPSGSAP